MSKYEYPSSYNKKIRTARKEHECDECGCKIKKGEEYEYVFGVWDGISVAYKTCKDCHL